MKSNFLLIFGLVLTVFGCKEMTLQVKKEAVKEKQIAEEFVFKVLDSAVLKEGKLFRVDSFPSQFVVPRTVDVWVPKSYSKDSTYAVLYMNDGQNLFDSTTTWNKQEWKVDETLSRLIQQDSIKNTIVVGVHSIPEFRHSDYFPQKPLEQLPSTAYDSVVVMAKNNDVSKTEFVSNSDNYLKFLVEEVKPQIDAQFSTKTGVEHTVIAGSSMGGLISWYAVTEYPRIFGGAICMSTHWPGAMPFEGNPLSEAYFSYLETKLPSLETHKFYFDYGDKTLDALYPPFATRVDAVFKEAGFTEDNFKNMFFKGTDHSEVSWQKRLHIPLKFTL